MHVSRIIITKELRVTNKYEHHKSNLNDTDTFNAFVCAQVNGKLFSIAAIHKYAVFRNRRTCPSLQTAIHSQLHKHWISFTPWMNSWALCVACSLMKRYPVCSRDNGTWNPAALISCTFSIFLTVSGVFIPADCVAIARQCLLVSLVSVAISSE